MDLSRLRRICAVYASDGINGYPFSLAVIKKALESKLNVCSLLFLHLQRDLPDALKNNQKKFAKGWQGKTFRATLWCSSTRFPFWSNSSRCPPPRGFSPKLPNCPPAFMTGVLNVWDEEVWRQIQERMEEMRRREQLWNEIEQLTDQLAEERRRLGNLPAETQWVPPPEPPAGGDPPADEDDDDEFRSLIGASNGPVLEVVCSRMRYMGNQLVSKLRIIALSTSLMNGRDVTHWLGCILFNFAPNARPVPLDLRIDGFNLSHTPTRLAAMVRPIYSAVIRHGGRLEPKPVLVFVPTRRQTRSLAVDLLTYALADRQENRFCHISPEEDPFKSILERLKDESLKETVKRGVGFLHEGSTTTDSESVQNLFNSGAIQICVVPYSMCYQIQMRAYLVIIMDTQFYNGKHHTYEDYPIGNVLHMVGLANKKDKEDDAACQCVLMCQTSKKDFFKKFLFEPLPVESHLDHCLHDHFNAEIVTKTIENKQDAIDYLTWTLLYRRMTQNPNYYNLHGTSHRHLSDSLSELVESTLKDLENSHCIAIKDDMYTTSLNLGMIAAYYYVSYTTIELFSLSLKPKTKLRALIEIVSNATEFSTLPIRHKEEVTLKKLADRLQGQMKNQKWNSPQVKVNLLLHAHLMRIQLSAELTKDTDWIVLKTVRLVQACVDVLSSNGWLSPAIHAMELSQMLTQAMYSNESYMKQLPHCTPELLERCKEKKVESIFELLELNDEDRDELLQMNQAQLADIAVFCNNYPSIEVRHEITTQKPTVGQPVEIRIDLERENDFNGFAPPVIAPFFPRYPYPAGRVPFYGHHYSPENLEEGWYLVIGDPNTNQLLSIKRLAVNVKAQHMLDFVPTQSSKSNFKLYFICDSYLGADQEFDLPLRIHDAPSSSEKSSRGERKRKHQQEDVK